MSSTETSAHLIYSPIGITARDGIRKLVSAGWSVCCIIGGAFLIEQMIFVWSVATSFLLPVILLLPLAMLYIGHNLISYLFVSHRFQKVYTKQPLDRLEVIVPDGRRLIVTKVTIAVTLAISTLGIANEKVVTATEVSKSLPEK